MYLNRPHPVEDAKAKAKYSMKYWKNTASAAAAEEQAGQAEVNRVSGLQIRHPFYPVR